MVKRLGRADWLIAARLALRRGGPAAVTVEGLARKLRVTKGSFYWHFADRRELLAVLLDEWEQETVSTIERAAQARSPRDAVKTLFEYTQQAAPASDKGLAPSDAAIFLWAQSDRTVAARVEATEKRRLAFLIEHSGRPDAVELVYLAWLGFVSRRMRNPRAVESVDLLASTAFALLFPPSRTRHRRTRACVLPTSAR